MKNKAYLWVRSAVILLLFVGGFLALLTFYNAKFQKIPPPVKILPQFYFAMGYLGLGMGGYLLVVTVRELRRPKQ